MNRLRASKYKNEGEHKKEIFSWQLLLALDYDLDPLGPHFHLVHLAFLHVTNLQSCGGGHMSGNSPPFVWLNFFFFF